MPPKRKIQINKDMVKKTNKKLSGKKNPNKIIGTSREQTRRESSQTGQSAKRTKTGTRPSQPTKENETMDISLEETSRKRLINDSDTSAEEPIKVPSAAKRLRLTEITPLEKAIEEVVKEGGASSESEISEEQTTQSSTESFLANVEKLLEMPQLSDEEGSLFSQDDELEYLKQHELDDIPDFFENFGDIPQVEDVSLDLAEEVLVGNLQAGELTESMDTGKFVNPLTGESSSSSKESLNKQEVETKPLKEMLKTTGDLLEEDEDEEPIIDQVSVDITIISDQEVEAEGTTQQMADEEDTFNQFLELETQGPTELVDEIDVDALARQETARLLLAQTYEFVQNLIDRAVYKAEYVDPKVILRQNLDKHKLMRELQDKLAILEVERRGKQFLNRKCVEYFRRKRSFRPITEDNPKTINQEYRKYLAAVQSLDKWLIREQEAKSLSKRNIDMLAGELQELKDRSLQESSNLDELIRRTLNRENFDRLHQIVENSLMKMNAVRKEISEVRFQLIQKQHNMASLVEKLRNLEDLGNGLSMRNFETLQTETQALGKKIEERNTELNKLRHRCHGDIHQMAHLKEKQKMIRETITFQRQYLHELQDEKQRLREFVFRQKIQRSQLRKEMKDISFQSGLLDKPVLMKDYDTTVEQLYEMRERVRQSKVTVNRINEKIALLEKQCNFTNKSMIFERK